MSGRSKTEENLLWHSEKQTGSMHVLQEICVVVQHKEKFLRMSSHYSTKHGGVNPEDPEF